MPDHVIGVDIGTTATKAVVFDLRGRVVAHANVGYPLLTPTPATAEQDPDEIHRAVVAAIRDAVRAARVAPDDIACVAFSAAMHSVIAVAGDGTALTRSITWADNRAARWAERIRAERDGMAIYRRTGTPIHPMSPLVKLAWLRDEQPKLFAAAARFVGIKEYVFNRLFGRWVVDHSIASATGLFNLATLDWDDGALELPASVASSFRRSCPRPITSRAWTAAWRPSWASTRQRLSSSARTTARSRTSASTRSSRARWP